MVTRAGPRTVSRQFDVLRAIFNYAVDSDVLGRSPCRGIRLPKPSVARRRVLTPTQLTDLAHALDEAYAPMVYVGAMLGLRWGECAGLRVGDLDLLTRTVTVIGQRTRGRGGRMIEGAPKSQAGRRTLSMPQPLVDMLAAHLRVRRLTAADADQYVFVGSRGRPLQYSAFRQRVWIPACRAIELPDLGFHDLRRTNAPAMVRMGVDVKTAQARLGHSDPRLTLGIYAQATTDGDRAAADRLADLLLDPSEEASRDKRGMEGAERDHTPSDLVGKGGFEPPASASRTLLGRPCTRFRLPLNWPFTATRCQARPVVATSLWHEFGTTPIGIPGAFWAPRSALRPAGCLVPRRCEP